MQPGTATVRRRGGDALYPGASPTSPANVVNCLAFRLLSTSPTHASGPFSCAKMTASKSSATILLRPIEPVQHQRQSRLNRLRPTIELTLALLAVILTVLGLVYTISSFIETNLANEIAERSYSLSLYLACKEHDVSSKPHAVPISMYVCTHCVTNLADPSSHELYAGYYSSSRNLTNRPFHKMQVTCGHSNRTFRATLIT